MHDEIECEARAAAVVAAGGRLGKRRPSATTWGSLKRWMAGALLAFCAANPMSATEAESRATEGGWSWLAEKAVAEAAQMKGHAPPLPPELPMSPVAPFGQEALDIQAQVPMGAVCRLGYWFCYLAVPLPVGQPCWCPATPVRPDFTGVVVLY